MTLPVPMLLCRLERLSLLFAAQGGFRLDGLSGLLSVSYTHLPLSFLALKKRLYLRKQDTGQCVHLMDCLLYTSQQETSRCLRCDHFGYGIFKGGRTSKW